MTRQNTDTNTDADDSSDWGKTWSNSGHSPLRPLRVVIRTAKENPERRLEIAAFTSLVLLSITFIVVVVAYGTLAF